MFIVDLLLAPSVYASKTGNFTPTVKKIEQNLVKTLLRC